jgi:hypothetical protein
MYFLHFIIAVLVGSGYSFDQSTPDTVRKPSPTFYSSGPVTEYNRAQPISSDALRFKRGERYNVPEPGVSELGESSEPILLDLAPTHFSRDPLPFYRSDTVVTGTVTAGQAYLTNDKRAIYSEFEVTLIDSIKKPNNLSLAPGDPIFIERKGGRIRLNSGKILVRGDETRSMPQIGKKYLFFLIHNPGTEDHSLITAYELGLAGVYRLDDYKYQESAHERTEHLLRREEMSEDQLLAHIRTCFQSHC